MADDIGLIATQYSLFSFDNSIRYSISVRAKFLTLSQAWHNNSIKHKIKH